MLETISFLWLAGIVRLCGYVWWRSPYLVISINGILAIFALINISKLWAPFWPSTKKKTQRMIALAQLKWGEIVYEIWSGDGRILRACLPYHPQKLIGYEISWILIWYSRCINRIRKESIMYKRVDLFTQDFRDADVIFCFLTPQALERIERDIRPTLKPGTKFISNIFDFKHIPLHHKEGLIYVYIK